MRGPCPSARLVIDRFDVWRQGAHAIWLTRNGPVVRTAAQSRGNPAVGRDRAAARAFAKALVAAHEGDESALNLDPVGAENARLIGLVRGLEGH